MAGHGPASARTLDSLLHSNHSPMMGSPPSCNNIATYTNVYFKLFHTQFHYCKRSFRMSIKCDISHAYCTGERI